MKVVMWRVMIFHAALLLTSEALATPSDPNKKNEDTVEEESKNSIKKKKTLNDVLSIGESIEKFQRIFQDPEIQEIRRQYWQKTFSEIKKLGKTGDRFIDEDKSPLTQKGRGILGQWKLLLDDSNTEAVEGETYRRETAQSSSEESSNATQATSVSQRQKIPRFEGFASWDRLLQDWADDVQEYLDSVQAESEMGGYSIGNFGRPMMPTNTTAEKVKHESATTAAEGEEFDLLRPAGTDMTTTAQQQEVIPELVAVDSKATTETNGISSSTSSSSTEATQTAAIRKEKVSVLKPQPRKPGEPILPHTDISDKSKRLLIVTTASLPWRTGTAVNPLLRAAYLTKGRKEAGGSVVLMLPWLERTRDQKRVYGDVAFTSPEEQEEYIRTWLRESAIMEQASQDLIIRWYTAWQNQAENSIYSMGDITALIPSESVDICILEEPEHLNWYRGPGESWTQKFPHVVGILHTNYFSYAMDQPGALIRAPAMRLLCSWMCRAHCHRVIKLSGTLDKVAPEKELVENVHGVRGTFQDVGEEVSRRLRSANIDEDPVFSPDAKASVYFIGKLLWSKGLGSLMELCKYAEESAELKVSIDMYGGGPDKEAAEKKAASLGLDMPFHGPVDHAELAYSHKIFVNPSTSEVLCTTSAEAIAMGKFAILPSHPSNDFFAQFPNCLTYTTSEEFVGNLYYALTHSPEPLTEEYSYALTWAAATERLEAAACIPEHEAELMKDTGVEIALPPLVESEKGRKVLAKSLHTTRERYRQFKNKLSKDIQESKVLPKGLRDRLVKDLDRRLDLDIDEILESPKLRLQLSPAELDRSLLDFYNNLSQSSGGDVVRVIGGAGRIGLQNFYMKRQAAKNNRYKFEAGAELDLLPAFVEEVYTEENERTTTQWVKWALSRNLPRNNRSRAAEKKTSVSQSNNNNSPRMCLQSGASSPRLAVWNGLRSPSRSNTFSLLI